MFGVLAPSDPGPVSGSQEGAAGGVRVDDVARSLAATTGARGAHPVLRDCAEAFTAKPIAMTLVIIDDPP